ncbi:MAG: cytidylate kinase family protein [Candidatus Woesearchaeota archaeon]
MIITISGKAGSGKSSVAKELSKRIGFEFFSVGKIRRQVAMSLGLSLEEFNRLSLEKKEYDFMVDDYQKKLNGNLVLDSRLGFFFHPNSIKVFLDVDPMVAAKRILEDKREIEDYSNLEEATRKVLERDNNDRLRLMNLYNIDFLDITNYDLILDTTSRTVGQVVELIVNFLKVKGFQMSESMIQKGDLVEIYYVGTLDDGTVFDTTDSNLVKGAKNQIIKVGALEIVSGLDEALIGKEIGKDYQIRISPEKGFGFRNPKLVRVYPLKEFQRHSVNPYPGLQVQIDDVFGTVKAVNGGRVIVDFNHPLSGFYLNYRFRIERVFRDRKEKVKAVLDKFGWNFEIYEEGDKIILKVPANTEINNQTIKEIFKNYLDLEIDVQTQK